ncbi:hypothetical protein TBLA_0C06310 [Henningerozyma blattae CBS 6284]|uniref:ERCC1-like central domain-containing protein n=1 Tax=Henningerozyma blattae (strain ATCC 34711 / CBS 6284 / DSM 70876 / NBRC 10599 / NRRL Y-10934 / UCD 77-7) TaxID=1071380 RepID=I2H224_HENB6|nr:hypothetical protein TBLA_0C06310 [Tetrapisispora blattae CBS 6284]CCH60426.1 hypothetical protein TBLA_0C06310 [Tetrapisispora blattae CBS 6284]
MNNTDPTSFQSILAGVKRLRESHGDDNDTEKVSQPTPIETNQSTKIDATGSLQNNTYRNNSTNHDIKERNSQPHLVSAISNSHNHSNDLKNNNLENSASKSSNNNYTPINRSNLTKTVLVNSTQRENPLLNHLKNTNWRYYKPPAGTKIYYDYFLHGRSVLFLTLSYHKLYNDYITRRMKPFTSSSNNSDNNILIFVVDDSNSEDTVKDLTKICMFNGFTLLLAFNFEQAAKYIEYLND